MTKLECSVGYCTSNERGYCCRPEVQVSGPHAQSSSDTCCSSFSAPLDKHAKNAVRSYTIPNPNMPVLCTAETCHYQESGVCHASQIKMGPSHATKANQTECGSFLPQS